MTSNEHSKAASLSSQMSGLLLDTGAESKEVNALMDLQHQHDQLSEQYYKELSDLEKKFSKLYQPLYQQRSTIVNGDDSQQAIPMFWAKVIQSHPILKTLTSDLDIEALSYLRDISFSFLEDNGDGEGFCLHFHFRNNPYFEESELLKKYYLAKPTKADYGSDIFDHAEGTTISWKDGKNLCFKTITKTQRHKSSGQTRNVTKTEIQKSFFHFFAPPTVPDSCEDLDEADAESLEASLQTDFELGEIFRTKIIPNAVEWYTGKALEYEDMFFSDDSCEDQTSESDDDGSEQFEERQSSTKALPNEQCKQQ